MSIKTEKTGKPESAQRRTLIMIAKLAIGLAIVYWLISTGRLDLNRYRNLLDQKAVVAMLGIGLAQFTGVSLTLARWYLLTSAQKIPLRLPEAMWLGYRGTFASLVLPGMLGLEGVRLFYLRRNYPNQLSAGVASIMVDRVLGLMGLLLLVVLFGVYYTMREQVSDLGRTFMFLGVSLFVAVFIGFGLMRLMRYVARALPRFQRINRLYLAIENYQNHPFRLGVSLLLSMAGHFSLCLAAWCGMTALRESVSLLAISTVSPLVTLLRILPISPLGLGVTDVAAEGLYPLVGLQGGAENQMLLRCIYILVSLLCGIAFLFRPSSKVAEESSNVAGKDFNAQISSSSQDSDDQHAEREIRL